MQARILFVSDLHKRDSDFTTIGGYTKAIDAVQEDILYFIEEQHITHLVSLGDWYDKGYRSINRLFNDMNYDVALSNSVDGNFYICRGNHLYIDRDQNPEMYLIQPCPDMPLVHDITDRKVPIIRSPSQIQIGSVLISLFHFSKEDKTYRRDVPDGITYHIGVYHDDVVLPSSVRQASGDLGFTRAESVEHYFRNVDLAICGHIHMPIGLTYVHLHDRKVPMYIPGSLCITKNKANEIHHSVKLPIITIEDDNTVKMQLAEFFLHFDMLHLYNKRDAEMLDSAFQSSPAVAERAKEIVEHINMTGQESLKEYLIKKGYSNQHIEIVDQAYSNELNPTVAGNILLGE